MCGRSDACSTRCSLGIGFFAVKRWGDPSRSYESRAGLEPNACGDSGRHSSFAPPVLARTHLEPLQPATEITFATHEFVYMKAGTVLVTTSTDPVPFRGEAEFRDLVER